jgi:hypothetical protein
LYTNPTLLQSNIENLKQRTSPTTNSLVVQNSFHPKPIEVVLKGLSVIAMSNVSIVPLSQQAMMYLKLQALRYSSKIPKIGCRFQLKI